MGLLALEVCEVPKHDFGSCGVPKFYSAKMKEH